MCFVAIYISMSKNKGMWKKQDKLQTSLIARQNLNKVLTGLAEELNRGDDRDNKMPKRVIFIFGFLL